MSIFKLEIDEAGLFKEAEADFRKKALDSLNKQLNSMFAEPRSWVQGDKGGIATQMIRESIENKLLSEKTQRTLDAYFEENWERLLKEEMEKSIRKAAEHKTRKMAFLAEGIKNWREFK